MKKIILILTVTILCSCAKKTIVRNADSVMDNAEYHTSQGLYYLDLDERTKAGISLMKSFTLNHKDFKTLGGLAVIEAFRSNFKMAYKFAEDAINIKDCGFSRVCLGRVYLINKNLNDALKQFEKAVKIEPTYGEGYYYLFIAYKGLNQREKANESLLRAMNLDPTNEKYTRAWDEYKDYQKVKDVFTVGEKIASSKALTRAEIAALLIHELTLDKRMSRVRKFEANNTFIPFDTSSKVISDIIVKDINNHWAEEFVNRLLVMRIPGLEADYTNRFYPDRTINLEQWCMILQNIISLVGNNKELLTKYYGEEESHIPGLRSDHPAYNALLVCVERGLVEARLDGRLDLGREVSGTEALIAVSKLKTILDFRQDSEY